MKISNMAAKNIKGNLYRYIMYYLSNVFAVAVFFIFANFIFHPTLQSAPISPSGTATVAVKNGIVACQVIIVIFSVLFVGYSTSMFLKSRGKEFGTSRIVCNVHWNSDVEAGRIIGAATVAKLLANEDFMIDLNAAKVELKRHQK